MDGQQGDASYLAVIERLATESYRDMLRARSAMARAMLERPACDSVLITIAERHGVPRERAEQVLRERRGRLSGDQRLT